MSIHVVAWLVSIAGAVAFAAMGFVFGRRRALVEPAAGSTAGGEGGASAASAASPASPVSPDATRVVAATAEPAWRPRPRSEAPTSREEGLARSLRALTGDPRDFAVLASESGLALAATGAADHEGLAALAGTAAMMFARVEDVLDAARVVRTDMRLEDGRRLQLRPLGVGGEALMVVVMGQTVPEDEAFEEARARLVRLVARDRVRS